MEGTIDLDSAVRRVPIELEMQVEKIKVSLEKPHYRPCHRVCFDPTDNRNLIPSLIPYFTSCFTSCVVLRYDWSFHSQTFYVTGVRTMEADHIVVDDLLSMKRVSTLMYRIQR